MDSITLNAEVLAAKERSLNLMFEEAGGGVNTKNKLRVF